MTGKAKIGKGMTGKTETQHLDGGSPGTGRSLIVHRYGAAGARPKAYVQASLHADEIPGMIAAHHLIRLLDQAETRGEIRGEIVVVPVANPIGLAQVVNGTHLGRFDLRGGGNFNRNWPDLFDGLEAAISDRLGQDEAANVEIIRAAIGKRLAERTALGEIPQLKLLLTRLAYDADIVLDLHCDDDSLLHIYMPPEHWSVYDDLAAELGAYACLTCVDSGSFCFDETFYTPWVKLQRALGDTFPIPAACFVSTVELRGQADVFDTLAIQDAEALYRFLQRHGLIAGDIGEAPALCCQPTPLDAADIVQAPEPGILAYRVAPGDRVKQGDLLAELIDPMQADQTQARTAIVAATDGLVLSRRQHKLVSAGDSVAMIVGTQSLKHRREKLMLD